MKMAYIESPNRAASSPEFEFRMPALEQNLLPADELFFKGMILPLAKLKPKPEPEPEPERKTRTLTLEPEPISRSKRWANIFKAPDKKKEISAGRTKMELNINLWPFSRSHSAGPASSSRQKLPAKSSSAPCSRSNSGRRHGEKERLRRSGLNLNVDGESNGGLFGLRALFTAKK